MMPSSTKNSRSHFSSPQHLSTSPNGNNRGVSTEGQRTFMKRWLEPPVQNKASFQEAGLMRGGVLENMAPLGTLPKPAMLKKPPVPTDGASGASGVKRIVLKKSAARPKTPTEESTPQPLARESPVREFAEAGLTSPTRPLFPATGLDDEEDEDYTPKPKKSRKSSMHSTMLQHPSRAGRRSSVRPAKSPTTSIQSPTPQTPTSLTFQAPKSAPNREPDDKELADKVVEAAVEEALRHYRYPTAWALRLLYDENSSDPHFVSMVEDVFHQRADIDTLLEFARLVTEKKKDGKKENKGCYYFVPPATSGRFTPHKPKAAPYGTLLTMDLTPSKGNSVDADVHVNKKVKLEGEGKGEGNHSSHGMNGTSGVKYPSDLRTSKSPKGRKSRSGSVSSDSSLSSVPDDVPDDFNSFMNQVDDDLFVSRPSAAEPNNAPAPADSAQPISNAQKKPAPKRKNVSPELDPSPNTTQPSHPHDHDSDMPAAVAATNGLPHHHIDHTLSGLKFPSRFGSLEDQLILSKQFTKQQTKSLTDLGSVESCERKRLEETGSVDGEVSGEEAALASTQQTRSHKTPALSGRGARAAKRHHDDLDDSSSPTAASFRADFEPPSTRNSRAATPSNLRATKKRAGPRVKTSPMKRKGTAAGIPRGSGERRSSPVGNGAPHDKDDNDDSCYTCGGNGELVCCDGCNYSFHFLCIDPPMDEGQIPDEWYCNECSAKFWPLQLVGHKGAFSSLLDILDKKNPRAFRLPQDVREFFEGVKTGPEGEYEETTSIARPKVNKKGFEEPFDFFKIRNAEGSAVLCHQCNESATDNRPIIPCSVCGLNWHLECLSPPLTIPPVLRTWRCPCHVEDALINRLAPSHKYRKIKHAPVIEQAYSRGLANNGHIEIEEDDDDDDDDEPTEAFQGNRDYGRVYRLPERGIKLDFIARVHQNRRQGLTRFHASNAALAVAPRVPTIEEQQVALNMSQLAKSGDGLSQLIGAMISQASPAAVAMMAQGDAQRIATSDLTEADGKALQAMLFQLDALKSGIGKILESRETKTGQALSPASTVDSKLYEPSTPSSKSDADTLDTIGEKVVDTIEDSAMQMD